MEQFTWTKNRYISVILHRAIAFNKIVLLYINQILRNGILNFQNGNISSSVYRLYLGFFSYFHSRNEEKPINMVQLLYKM